MILFPTCLKFPLVYFKIFLKIFEAIFCTVVEMCVVGIFLKIGFLEIRQPTKVHPHMHTLEGKHF